MPIETYVHYSIVKAICNEYCRFVLPKKTTIDVLPNVLILHLKRFAFRSQGAVKIHKFIQYPLTLTFHPNWLTSPRDYNTTQRTYNLFSVVEHRGSKVTGGHYTCDVHQTDTLWLHFDDHTIQRTSPSLILDRQAYLLLYIYIPNWFPKSIFMSEFLESIHISSCM